MTFFLQRPPRTPPQLRTHFLDDSPKSNVILWQLSLQSSYHTLAIPICNDLQFVFFKSKSEIQWCNPNARWRWSQRYTHPQRWEGEEKKLAKIVGIAAILISIGASNLPFYRSCLLLCWKKEITAIFHIIATPSIFMHKQLGCFLSGKKGLIFLWSQKKGVKAQEVKMH